MIYPWQQAIWQQLQTSRQQQRLHHALLLGGHEGFGKLALAKQFAASLLCEQITEDGLACGQCHGCRLRLSGNHPDFLLLEPSERGKQITIDQVRQLQQFCALTANYGGYQVIIIQPAEAMNHNAANSLLKLLEEPPAKTLFLLISHRPMALLATIRSRCQQLDLSHVSEHVTHAWLQEQLPQRSDTALLLHLAHHAPLLAQQLAEGDALEKRRWLFETLESLTNQQTDPVKTAEQWNKHDVLQLIQWMLSWTQDMLRFQLTADAQQIHNQDWQTQLGQFSQRYQTAKLFQLLDLQQETYRLLLGTNNLNSQTLLESVAIAWVE